MAKAQSSMAAKAHVEDSSMGSPSFHTHDTDTSVLDAGLGISGDLSTRLYVGSFEIDIGQSLQKETVSPRSCTLDFDMVPVSFQVIDSTHDDILSTPNSGSGHLQLLAGRGFDGETAEGNNEVVVRSTHPNMSCESSTLCSLVDCFLIQDLETCYILELGGNKVAQQKALGIGQKVLSIGFPTAWMQEVHHHSSGQQLVEIP